MKAIYLFIYVPFASALKEGVFLCETQVKISYSYYLKVQEKV